MRRVRVDVAVPYSLERTIGSFTRFPEELVDNVVDGEFRRCLLIGSEPVLLGAAQPENSLTGTVEISILTQGTPSETSFPVLSDVVTRMIGVQEPIEPVYQMMEQNPRLRFLMSKLRGLRRTLSATPFEGVVASILAQLISIRGAAVIRSRLVQRFGQRLEHEGSVFWTFPDPCVVCESSVDELCRLGMTGAKARAILAVANLSQSGELDLQQLAAQSDSDVIRHLTALPGIGPWTAEWFLVNVLGRMSIVPSGDLGIRRSTGKWLLNGEMPSPAETRKIYEPFGEHRAYIAYYVLSADRYTLTRPEF